jgi:pilus assembly protein CpaF
MRKESKRPAVNRETGTLPLRTRLRRQLMHYLEQSREQTEEELFLQIDDLILAQAETKRMPIEQREKLRTDLFNSVRRLDVLQELVDDRSITEVMVNDYRTIFVEKNGIIFKWPKQFESVERLEDVIRQIAGRCNRVVNEQRPIADARLPDGSRVNIVLPPVSLNGPMLTIRKFPEKPLTMEALVRAGSMTPEAAVFLKKLVRSGYSILVGGGTSTGKTTFLNALSACIPEGERIVTIEDNAELQLQACDNLVRLEVREANLAGDHAITMRDLIRTSLRMRPNRIIVGEVRGGEAYDWLTCLNTGHDGSLGSAHANSTRDMIGRLETMVLMAIDLPIPVIRRQIASGIEILVHLVRDPSGARRLDEIAEIEGMADGEICLRTIYKRSEVGVLEKKNDLKNRKKLLR